jgi:PTS system cellobiose-specific IIC component
LATGKISGAVIQLVNLAIGGLVYYPFFKIADRQALQQEEAKRAEMNA